MKTAIYARVSTRGQEVDNQLAVLTKWVTDRGWEIGDIYQEAESAWRSGHQREFSRMLAAVHKRKYDLVVVWALDRITRTGAAAILQIINGINSYGCRVVSYQEPWTEAPGGMGEILLAITGWVARMESDRRSERTLAGLARARAAGKRIGRPPGSKDKRKRVRWGTRTRRQAWAA